MPLLVEEEVRSPTGFDSQAAITLFWKPVPVLVKHADREDQFEELTFRILSGVSRHNHNLRVLRTHISSEVDLTFLHTLEVSEEDFQSLKNEQGILVDFASFPGKIISLLERCTSVQPTESPKFQAVLTVRGSESIFRIVETNDFKQLPHITLAFRPGNDFAVKQFLAFRLTEVKATCDNLGQELQRSKDDGDDTRTQLANCRAQLAELKDAHDRHMLEFEAKSKAQQAAAFEEKAVEKAALTKQYEQEKQELERKLREQLDALNSKVAALDTENRKLRDTKFDLDSKVSQLSHKLGTLEGTRQVLDEENTKFRSQNQALSLEKHELDVRLNEAKAKILALEQKVSSQTEIIEQQKARARDMEASLRQLESRCTELKDVAGSNDQRAKDAQAEVLKGNQVIEKLMNDLKLSKEKVKRKQAIIVRQEEELQQREQALASSSRDIQALRQGADSAQAEFHMLRSENAELKAKLEDSKQQLQSNEQMIRWLNQQVTEAQLQVTGAVPGSRYTFRPALPAATSGPSTSLSNPASTPATLGLVSAKGTSYAHKYASSTAATTYTPSSPSRGVPSYLRPTEPSSVHGLSSIGSDITPSHFSRA